MFNFFQPLVDIRVQEGEKLVLEIIVHGHPEPIVKWFRETIEINNSPDYQVVQQNDRYLLIIAEVFPEDAGRYEAVAVNAEGITRTEANIYVEGQYNLCVIFC